MGHNNMGPGPEWHLHVIEVTIAPPDGSLILVKARSYPICLDPSAPSSLSPSPFPPTSPPSTPLPLR